MNYDEMPKQIRCRMCKTIQDAGHKYCKECGVSFIGETYSAPDRSMLDKWIEAERMPIKRGIEWISTMPCDSVQPKVTSCISTSPEAAKKMAERFYCSYPKYGTTDHCNDIIVKTETRQRAMEMLNKINKQ